MRGNELHRAQLASGEATASILDRRGIGLDRTLIRNGVARLRLGSARATISYLGSKLAEAASDWFFRVVSLGVAGVCLATYFGGGLPDDPRGLLMALPLGLVAGIVGVLFYAWIGLLAVWLLDCTPVYWIWQKVAFVCGGLLLPLEIYPVWLQRVAAWTPFSAMMHGPGRMAFGHQPELALELALRLAAWAAVATLLVWATHRRALHALEINGG